MKRFHVTTVAFMITALIGQSTVYAQSLGHAHAEPSYMQDLNCKVVDKIKHSDDKYECEVNMRGNWVGNTGRTERDANRETWCKTFGFFCENNS